MRFEAAGAERSVPLKPGDGCWDSLLTEYPGSERVSAGEKLTCELRIK